jgi:hypothetical protein
MTHMQQQDCIEQHSINYTAHHNWAWVLKEALKQVSQKYKKRGINVHLCDRFTELPSQIKIKEMESKINSDSKKKKSKIKYALFRIEIEKNHNNDNNNGNSTHNSNDDSNDDDHFLTNFCDAWATSSAFAFLDAKDALYRELLKQNAHHLMPLTTLLHWNLDTITDIGVLPSSPAILKAALGSGRELGSGLGFELGLDLGSECNDSKGSFRVISYFANERENRS